MIAQIMNKIEREEMVPKSMLEAACLGDYIGRHGVRTLSNNM